MSRPDEARRRAEEEQAEAAAFFADEFVGGVRPLSSGRSRGRGPAPAPSRKGPAPRPRRQQDAHEHLEGLADGSPEAAAALLRLPGVHVVVDGYNVSRRAWRGISMAEERDRVVRALDDLAARTGARATVVFDGADVPPTGVRAGTRSVDVRFSAAGEPADHLVLDCVVGIRRGVPVVVVSSDREVRVGAERRGAHVVHAEAFLAVVRR